MKKIRISLPGFDGVLIALAMRTGGLEISSCYSQQGISIHVPRSYPSSILHSLSTDCGTTWFFTFKESEVSVTGLRRLLPSA